ncbi:hypothetical protein C9H16_01855 [Salmonella enterica]|nr:hypothetical protein [Salmonella enterica]
MKKTESIGYRIDDCCVECRDSHYGCLMELVDALGMTPRLSDKQALHAALSMLQGEDIRQLVGLNRLSTEQLGEINNNLGGIAQSLDSIARSLKWLASNTGK